MGGGRKVVSERSEDPLTKLRLSGQARPERRSGRVLPSEDLHCHPKRCVGWAKDGGREVLQFLR
jgi:hypothetical protein